MPIDRISDMIAHFIGLFDTVIEEARLRTNYSEGPAHSNPDRLPDDEAAKLLDKNYDVPLEDYDPGVKYRAGYYDFDYVRPNFVRPVEYDMQQFANAIPVDISAANFRFPGRLSFENERELVVHTGPGSVIAHVSQVNILQDDDYLNMTDGPNVARDTSFVTQRTVEFYNEASVFTPFPVSSAPTVTTPCRRSPNPPMITSSTPVKTTSPRLAPMPTRISFWPVTISTAFTSMAWQPAKSLFLTTTCPIAVSPSHRKSRKKRCAAA